MARAASEEEIQLRKRARRRLVGAIVLVLAVVVFLPMLLDTGPEVRKQEIDIRIPSEDSVEPLGESLGAGEPSGGAALGDSTAPPGSALTVPKPQPEDRENEESGRPIKPGAPVDSGTGKQVETNRVARGEAERGEAEAGKPSSVAGGGFVVQLGAFSSPAKAREQVQILASRDPGEYVAGGGMPAAKVYTETLKADRGSGKSEVTRVRIGPFATREQADAALARIKLQGLDGVVTDK